LAFVQRFINYFCHCFVSISKSPVSFSAALPEDIGKLKKLETLLLANNRIAKLPATISNLSALRTVNLSKNGIQQFPAELCGLKNLDSIDLSHNNIVVIPDGVRGLQAVELNVNQNQVRDNPDCLLYNEIRSFYRY
jgi:Leucine-rich repeat (LRR) protein